MAKSPFVWHWICEHCADVEHVARVYRVDGTRRPGQLCCFCLERPTLHCLEAHDRKKSTCKCR